MYKNPIALLLCLLVSPFIFSQQTQLLTGFEIEWSKNTIAVPSADGLKQVETPYFKDAVYDYQLHALPFWSKKIGLIQGAQVTAKIRNARYEPLGFANLPDFNDLLSHDIAVEAVVGYEKKQANALISLLPFRLNPLTSETERLVDFDLELKTQGSSGQNLAKSNRSYTTNSVLNQGTFYQFKTDKNGIYKIDFSFLQSLGISSTVNLSNLRIYGNGGGMLSELAGSEKPDDLVEIPVQVVDLNSNNVFDAGDYVLFYAEGPDKWQYNSTQGRYIFQKHIYSDYAAYFLNFDIGTGLRIGSQLQSTSYNTEVTSFADYAIHQKDLIQPIKSGRLWLGEEFNVELSQNFSFSFPNLDTETPVQIKTQVASRYVTGNSSGSLTNFYVKANGTQIQNVSITSVTGSYEGWYARLASGTSQFTANSSDLTINLTYNRPAVSAIGWLDFIELNARRHLIFTGPQMIFSDPKSVGTNKQSKFIIQSNTSNIRVWEVTKLNEAVQWDLTAEAGNQYVFYVPTPTLRQFIVFDGSQFYTPQATGILTQQNLHAEETPDLIIVSYPDFLPAAERLANFRRTHDNLEVKVVTPQQIYYEFSSGIPDMAAIRDYVKMYYDRAGTNTDLMPHYLLLFGDASFDYKGIEFKVGNNHNFVPTYESTESLNAVETYCTDDFFGLLDDDEGQNINTTNQFLDIAIGRIPVATLEEAEKVVDKIIHYDESASLGEWRNNITFIADDEDGNLHLDDAQIHVANVEENNPVYNIDKIYLDAYPQISTAGGNLYPDVNTAINNKIFSGTFIMNYVGHGGESGWAHERILKTEDIRSWSNLNQMPLFITATCSFSRYDNPEKVSAGEMLMTKSDGGGIALMTTVRLVYATANQRLNTAFINRLFQVENDKHLSLGEIARRSKNDATLLTSSINNRKFVLLGDPSLILNYPKHQAVITSVNNHPIPSGIEAADTLKALSRVTMTGEIRNKNGEKLTDFNGIVYSTVFDKSVQVHTMVNDVYSEHDTFNLRKNIIFKGKATVTNGEFSFTFITPKDISYQFGAGRVSLYADNGVNTDAHGFTEQIIIGGVAEDVQTDAQGPEIKLFMNDEKFVFGGMTNTNPVLIAKLADENGINTVGNGIGRNISAILNDDNKNSIVLNQYYKASLDNYKEGEIRYPLSDLPEGLHQLTVNAWDTHNNAGKGYTEFIVAQSAELALKHVLNYPNPFTDNTAFWFEHNRPNDQLLITVQIFTLSGRVVKTLQQSLVAEGFRVDSMTWDGRDDFGNKIGRGTYVYKLSVRSLTDHKVAHKVQKLVLLK